MIISKDFEHTSVSGRIPPMQDPLGLLAGLVGTWRGSGFNQIWRPFHGEPPKQDHFLELNEYTEELQFDIMPGNIPNRGLLQDDINLAGLTYLQQINDANVLGPNNKPAGLHIEPGVWLNIPSTTHPPEPPTVARMGNVPHGTSFVAQGTASLFDDAPKIPSVIITPFPINKPPIPANLISFPESNLKNATQFRTPHKDIPNVTQEMVDNPNIVLTQGIAGKNIISTTFLKISTADLKPPFTGGGISNIAFLQGKSAPNAEPSFWIEKIKMPNGSISFQLQYSQRILLNFAGLSWPHLSAATLLKQ